MDITEYRKSYKIVLRITAIQKEEDDFAIKREPVMSSLNL